MSKQITIYSNGVTDILEKISVSPNKDAAVVIRTNKESISDILGSLNIYSEKPLQLKSIPIFDQTNDYHRSVDNVFGDISNILRGSTVAFNENKQTFVGFQRHEKDIYFVFYKDGQISTYSVEDFNVSLTKEIRAKFEDVFQKNSETCLTFVLSAHEATEASVRYIIPSSIWKFSYRYNEDTLTGFAVVDNTTEEDWEDVQMRLVLGRPVAIASDLATPYYERRSNPQANIYSARTPFYPLDDTKSVQQFAFGSANLEASCDYDESVQTFSEDIQPVLQVEDFCIFTIPEKVSIPSKKSALLPIVNEKLQGELILRCEANNPNKIYRTFKIKNTTDYTLGKGPCSVYVDNVFCGITTFKDTKPQKEQNVVYAAESGVEVIRKNPEQISKTKYSIKKGKVSVTQNTINKVVFEIKNNKLDSFNFELGYTSSFSKTETSSLEVVPMVGGIPLLGKEIVIKFQDENRNDFLFAIKEAEAFTLEVIEKESFKQGSQKLNVLDKAPEAIANLPLVKEYLDLSESILGKKSEIKLIEKQLVEIKEKINTNQAMKEDKEIADKIKEYLNTYNQLNDETIPKINERVATLRRKLYDVCNSINAEWEE